MDETLDPQTLRQLIGRQSQGDEQAHSALLDHAAQRLESLARQMLRGFPALRRWVETNDVLQNALIRLMRALRDVELASPRHFMALSALQIRRELIDLTRHYYGPNGLAANQESHGGNNSEQRVALEVADPGSEPDESAHWREIHEQIGALPEREREVMDLLFYDGLSQANAAELLEVTVRTVQRRWHSALLRLHEALSK